MRIVTAVRILGAGLVLCGARPSLLSGQKGREYIPTLDSIGAGCCTIRVRQNGLMAQGRFQGRSDRGRVFISPCSGPLCGTASDSVRGFHLLPSALVEMRRGTLAAKGLLIGAISGAGLVLGIVLIDGCDCDISAADYALLGLIGGAGGGALGTLTGALMPNWTPIRH